MFLVFWMYICIWMYICLAKIHCLHFRLALHILEAMDVCGMEGEKCELDQCHEEGVRAPRQLYLLQRKRRLWKAITVRSKRVMVSNQERRKEFISEQ